MARKAKKVDPRYAVNISMKAWDIAKAGAAVKLRVRDRSGLLGTIEIGQGTFGWKSARARSFKRISWGQLADKLERSGEKKSGRQVSGMRSDACLKRMVSTKARSLLAKPPR